MDMSVNGEGEWEKFDRASFYGAPFIWTTLHDFGGTDGMKGNLEQINRIPFDGLAPVFNSTVWGCDAVIVSHFCLFSVLLCCILSFVFIFNS
jgi:hypothetical protein